jgi:pimeloyl-ACP methyl ester carboxylesterase
MTQQAVRYEDSDILLESGRLRARRWGAADAPAAVCVPGLSANLCGFDRLAERLASGILQLVAIDLRGRGRSEVTGAGTCGWRNHARDVLDIADAVGAPSFAVIGQSSGAAIAMTCAHLEPSRVEQLVLVDLVGSPYQRAAVPVVASVSRLGTVYPSAQAAIALIKQIGFIPEWDEYWDRSFAYELRDVSGGVASSSDRGAVLEDLGYGGDVLAGPGSAHPRAVERDHHASAGAASPARDHARVQVHPARRGGGAVRGGGAIRSRGGDRRESLHDHHVRRFDRRHQCVPAHELTPLSDAARRSPSIRSSRSELCRMGRRWPRGTSPARVAVPPGRRSRQMAP